VEDEAEEQKKRKGRGVEAEEEKQKKRKKLKKRKRKRMRTRKRRRRRRSKRRRRTFIKKLCNGAKYQRRSRRVKGPTQHSLNNFPVVPDKIRNLLDYLSRSS